MIESVTQSRSPLLPVHDLVPEGCGDSPTFWVGDIEGGGPGHVTGTPHRHDFTELHYVSHGEGWHVIDGERYRLGGSQLYLVARGQVHHWECDEQVLGTEVLFRDEFLSTALAERVVSSAAHDDLYTEGFAVLDLDTDARERLERLLTDIRDEFGSVQPGRHVALQNLLLLVLVHARRLAPQASLNRRSSLYRRFARMLVAEPSAALTVSQCAARLGVTPGYLYELVTAESGSTPGELIRGATLREAQRLLAGTELSCAQIAGLLGFYDASYFSRFFRRESGSTPTAFRDRQRDSYGSTSAA